MKMERGPLIFSASIGNGHNQAAKALQVEFQNKGYQPKIIDTFYSLSPALHKFMLTSYVNLLKVGPRIWQKIYFQAEKYPLFLFLDQFATFFVESLHATVKSNRCSFLVSTHPFVTAFLVRLKSKKQLNLPLYTVITDFVLHPAYLRPEIDGYFTSDPNFTDFAKLNNVSDDRFFPTGIPIPNLESIDQPKWKVRNDLGLDPQRKVLIIAGGGIGLTNYAQVIRALECLPEPIQLLCMIGHNYQVKEKISRIKSKHELKVIEFTNKFLLYLKASDAILSKAGGLTMAESLVCETPIIIHQPVPGHEEHNAKFLIDAGAALRVKGSKEIPTTIKRVLYEEACFGPMIENARKLKKPNAANEIVEQMLLLVKEQQHAFR
jgi:processive 1,2-diacylglycerol beta-glucosyltransferase